MPQKQSKIFQSMINLPTFFSHNNQQNSFSIALRGKVGTRDDKTIKTMNTDEQEETFIKDS